MKTINTMNVIFSVLLASSVLVSSIYLILVGYVNSNFTAMAMGIVMIVSTIFLAFIFHKENKENKKEESADKYLHRVVGIGEYSVIMLSGSKEIMDDEEMINTYLCSLGHIAYKYLDRSKVHNHINDDVSALFILHTDVLFESKEQMEEAFRLLCDA